MHNLIGKKVRITRRRYGHKFNIGEVVLVTDFAPQNSYACYLAISATPIVSEETGIRWPPPPGSWYIAPTEFELVLEVDDDKLERARMKELVGNKVVFKKSLGDNIPFRSGEILFVEKNEQWNYEDERSYLCRSEITNETRWLMREEFDLLQEGKSGTEINTHLIPNTTTISRRDYFAAAALQGMLAKRFDEPGEGVAEIVFDAIEYADELIKQLDNITK